MIRMLMMRSPALRGLPRWLLMTAVVGSVVAGLAVWRATVLSNSGAEPAPALWRALGWRAVTPDATGVALVGAGMGAVLMLYLLFGQSRRRCSRYDMTLPIPARTLEAASLAGALLAAWVQVIVLFVVVGIQLAMIDYVGMRSPLGWSRLGWQAALLAATMVPGVALTRLRRPELNAAPFGGRQIAIVLPGVTILWNLAIVLGERPQLGCVVMLALGGALLLIERRRTPEAFELVSRAPESRGDADAAGEADVRPIRALKGPRLQWTLLIALLRGSPKWRMILGMVLPFVVIFALLDAGLLTLQSGSDGVRFTMLPMTAYLLYAATVPLLTGLRGVDAWPVSRRRLLALVLLPFLGVFGFFYAGVGIVRDANPARTASLVYSTDGDDPGLRVPKDMWRVAWTGHVPEATAPWGETHPAASRALVSGLPPRLYKPYTTPADASRDFVAWQIARAWTDLTGEDAPPSRFASALTTGADGVVRPADVGTPLETLISHGRVRAEGPHFPLIVIWLTVVWWGGLAVYLPRLRAGGGVVRRRVTSVAILGTLLVAHLVPYLLTMAHVSDFWYWETAWQEAGRSFASVVPGGTFGMWILAAVAASAMFELTLSSYRRVEAVACQGSCMWGGDPGKDG